MLLPARTPTVRTASMALLFVTSLMVELAGSGRLHDTLEAARPHAPAPRLPSISDAALSPVEPISVLRSLTVASARLLVKSWRASIPRLRALRVTSPYQ